MRQFENIKVFIVDTLPIGTHGFTVRTTDNEDFYCIVLNGKLSQSALIKAYDHEMEHINNHDEDSIYSADQIEYLRHAG